MDRSIGLSRVQEEVQRWKRARMAATNEVAAREGELRYELQAAKNRLIELKRECEMRKSELIYAAKTMLTQEQFADFEKAKQRYHTLPADEKRFPY
jgi:hypothetical protein